MKCLVVDDSAITRRILVNSLRAAGFEQVLEATDGRQALQVCDDSIDVVITDWNMPAMNGLELVRNLRANPAFASLPILLISARNEREDVVEAARAGADGYMVKPFTPETLRAKLDAVLRSRQDDAAGSGAAGAESAEPSGEVQGGGSGAGAEAGTEAASEPATGTDG